MLCSSCRCRPLQAHHVLMSAASATPSATKPRSLPTPAPSKDLPEDLGQTNSILVGIGCQPGVHRPKPRSGVLLIRFKNCGGRVEGANRSVGRRRARSQYADQAPRMIGPHGSEMSFAQSNCRSSRIVEGLGGRIYAP